MSGKTFELGRTRSQCIALALLLAVSIPTNRAIAEECKANLLVIDHKTGAARFLDGDFGSGDDIRVPIKVPVVVKVENTNTALYDFQIGTEKFEAEEIGALRGFLKNLGPYFVELGREALKGRGEIDTELKHAFVVGVPEEAKVPLAVRLQELKEKLEKEIDDLRDALTGVNASLFGPKGIVNTELQAQQILAAMADGDNEPKAIQDLLPRFRTAKAEPDKDCCCQPPPRRRRLLAVEELTEALQELTNLNLDGIEMEISELDAEAEQLGKEITAKAPKDEDLKETFTAFRAALKRSAAMVDSARKALGDSGKLIASARSVERFAARIVDAQPEWCSEKIGISAAKGRSIKVTITPRADPEGLAPRPKVEFEAALHPDWLIRPAVGLGLMWAKDARYPQFATKEEIVEEKKKHRIIRSGEQDATWDYGLTLGTTWRGLDWRDDWGGALWLPELTVNPSDNVRAMGVGVGFSLLKIVKLGAGVLWTRHTVLDGRSVGDLLDDPAELRVRNSYGKGKLYFSFSLVGWPPFLNE